MTKRDLPWWLIGVLAGLAIIMIVVGAISATSFVEHIKDPTERGLAYMALAIAFHALFFRKGYLDKRKDV